MKRISGSQINWFMTHTHLNLESCLDNLYLLELGSRMYDALQRPQLTVMIQLLSVETRRRSVGVGLGRVVGKQRCEMRDLRLLCMQLLLEAEDLGQYGLRFGGALRLLDLLFMLAQLEREAVGLGRECLDFFSLCLRHPLQCARVARLLMHRRLRRNQPPRELYRPQLYQAT
jgi:hypothetical protein